VHNHAHANAQPHTRPPQAHLRLCCTRLARMGLLGVHHHAHANAHPNTRPHTSPPAASVALGLPRWGYWCFDCAPSCSRIRPTTHTPPHKPTCRLCCTRLARMWAKGAWGVPGPGDSGRGGIVPSAGRCTVVKQMLYSCKRACTYTYTHMGTGNTCSV
jgi:hypothetical protein